MASQLCRNPDIVTSLQHSIDRAKSAIDSRRDRGNSLALPAAELFIMRPISNFCEGSPRTIADAIETLAVAANFNNLDQAKILVDPLRLPSAMIVWQTLVVFERADNAEGSVVPFRAAERFFAFEEEGSSKMGFEMPLLADAVVGFDGAVTLRDGRRLRAVEIMPTQMPYELSELDLKIIHITLSMIEGAESRCYRDIQDGLPEWARNALPSARLLDFSQLTEDDDRPALMVPLLKQIRAEFQDTYPDSHPPSEQKISDALEKAGIRIPERRPRAA